MLGIGELFTLVIYQPFFNILVFFYYMLSQGSSTPDMGVAVILLTLLIRFLMLPMSLAGHKSEYDKRKIETDVATAHLEHSHDPISQKSTRNHILRSNRGLVWTEILSFFIQLMISLMLWRIFETGLKGDDLHLIYSFMPQVDQPFNLIFLNKFDLTKTSYTLNFIQSILIFILETISIYTSPFKPRPGEVVRMQLIMPVVAFIIFLRLPAGKKLFVITALIVSIFLTIFKAIRRSFANYRKRKVNDESIQTEKLVSVVK